MGGSNPVLMAITTDPELVKYIPTIVAQNEEELQRVSSELGRLLGANVHRLANGVVIIKFIC